MKINLLTRIHFWVANSLLIFGSEILLHFGYSSSWLVSFSLRVSISPFLSLAHPVSKRALLLGKSLVKHFVCSLFNCNDASCMVWTWNTHTHKNSCTYMQTNKQTTHQFAHSLASYNSCWLRWFSLRVENMSAILELQFQTCSAIDSRNLVTYRNGIEDREMANERTEPVSQQQRTSARFVRYSMHLHASHRTLKEVEVSIMHYVINESQAPANFVHRKFSIYAFPPKSIPHNRWIRNRRPIFVTATALPAAARAHAIEWRQSMFVPQLNNVWGERNSIS